MTLTMLGIIVMLALLVPGFLLGRKLKIAGVRQIDSLVYSFIAISGIWTIAIVVTFGTLLYIGWKAEATPLPGTDITELVDTLCSQARYSIIIASITVISWYTGMPYRSLRRIDLENNIGTEALEKARNAWRPAMLFCSILHLVGAYGTIVLIRFLRTTVT